MDDQKNRIFISSPGDVADERRRVALVILNALRILKGRGRFMRSASRDQSVGVTTSKSTSPGELAELPETVPAIQYDAFISYSHAADGCLAPALHSGLQRFATPWRLFRLTNPVRSLRIFQDTASLSANPALWPTIERALMASYY